MSSPSWTRYYRMWIGYLMSYSFSANISTIFIQAYAIRVLDYGVSELGTLTFVNLASLSLGNMLSPIILYRYRNRRVSLWKAFISISVTSWSLSGFSDLTPSRYSLYALVAIAQFSGAIGNLAYSDTISDAVPKEESVRVFGRANALSTLSALVALTSTVVLFGVMGPQTLSYRICYSLSLAVASVSAAFLLRMWDLRKRDPVRLSFGDVYEGYRRVLNDGRIRNYVLFMVYFTFCVNIPGALWNYYIINVFDGSETWISINNIASTLATSLGNYTLSRLYRRVDPSRVLKVAIIPISLVPLLFLTAYTMTYQALLNLFSGFSWSMFNLVVGIYNLYLASESKRIYMLSMLGVMTNVVAAAASKLGSSIASISLLAMQSTFIASFIGRVLMYVYSRKRLPTL